MNSSMCNCTACCTTCHAKELAATAIVSPLLLALTVGGVIAVIFLIKKKKGTKALLLRFRRRIISLSVNTERFFTRNAVLDMDNPTYETEVVVPSTAATPHGPKLPVYETVTSFENSTAEINLEQNYDVIREDLIDTDATTIHHNYDTVASGKNPGASNDKVCGSPPKPVSKPAISVKPPTTAYAISGVPDATESKPPTTAYAISDVPDATESKPPTTAYAISDVPDATESKPLQKVGHKLMDRINSLEGSRVMPKMYSQKKRPVPSPKPSKAVGKTDLTKSASVSHERTNYCQLDPKSKYAALEPHITSSMQGGVVKTENSSNSKEKQQYSHLNR